MGLIVNKKTQYMATRSNTEELCFDLTSIKSTKNYKYLGFMISNDGLTEKEMFKGLLKERVIIFS